MKRFIALAAACALVPLASAQLYKYVDKDGKTVYSDQPPPNADSKQLNIHSGTTKDSPAAAAPKTAVERDKELQKIRDEDKEKAKKAEDASKLASQKEAACKQAQSNYQIYADGGRITKYDDKGERVYLGDDEILAEQERTKREMDEACKKS
jgi:predicted Zn-dependent peptidase